MQKFYKGVLLVYQNGVELLQAKGILNDVLSAEGTDIDSLEIYKGGYIVKHIGVKGYTAFYKGERETHASIKGAKLFIENQTEKEYFNSQEYGY